MTRQTPVEKNTSKRPTGFGPEQAAAFRARLSIDAPTRERQREQDKQRQAK
jgi:hypothetical protein